MTSNRAPAAGDAPRGERWRYERAAPATGRSFSFDEAAWGRAGRDARRATGCDGAAMVALVFVAAFVAFLASAVAGDGAGLVARAGPARVVPIAGVPAALAIGRAASAGSRIALLRRSIRRDVVRRFVPAVLPGVWLRSRIEPARIEFIAGCFLRANLPAPFRRRARAAQPPLSSRAVPLIGEGAFRRVMARWLRRARRRSCRRAIRSRGGIAPG